MSETSTPAAPERHLWEYDHPYIGPESDDPEHHESWADFLETSSVSDPDYNLLFRWDWIRRPDNWQDEYDEEPPADQLHLFYVLQRKGRVWSETVIVTPEDEASVREWLSERVAYLMRVNEGI